MESFINLSHYNLAKSLTIFSSNLLLSILDMYYLALEFVLFSNPVS